MKKTTRMILFALAVLLAAPSWAYDKDKLYQIVSVKFPDKAWTYADGVSQVSLKAIDVKDKNQLWQVGFRTRILWNWIFRRRIHRRTPKIIWKYLIVKIFYI